MTLPFSMTHALLTRRILLTSAPSRGGGRDDVDGGSGKTGAEREMESAGSAVGKERGGADRKRGSRGREGMWRRRENWGGREGGGGERKDSHKSAEWMVETMTGS